MKTKKTAAPVTTEAPAAPITVERRTRADADFYSLLGPFLSRREIVAELGAPVWDDDEKTWFVVHIKGAVAGFRAVTVKGRVATFCSAYVLPAHRRQGIYAALIADALDYARGVADSAKATVRADAAPALKAAGFKATGTRGQFTLMERALP